MRRKTFEVLVFTGANLIIAAIVIAINLYTLTYTAVPVQSQHLWYATDLQTYIFWSHLFTTVIGGVCMIAFDIFLIVEKIKDSKAIKEE
jgi:hypothetical protein